MASALLMWTDIVSRLRGLWEAQNRTNRLLAAGVISVVGIGLLGVFGVYAFKKPDYQTLFSNLSAEDASSISQKLRDDKVPYQLTDGGATIKVPADIVYEERVQLAGAGLVKGGGMGYELFDRTNLGMTDFQEKIQKTRAIEGELQRTIAGLTPVEAARVHVAQPDATLYSNAQQPTTASIAIKTKPGMSLSPSEVKGITELVSGAVEGLKPTNVTIVNQDGNVLIPTPGGAGTTDVASALKLTQEQLDAKQRYENTLQQNLQSMLDATLGPKKSAVRVAVEMNFDVNSTEQKSFNPTGTVRSEQTERETYNGTQPARQAAGVPGTTTNVLPTYQGQQAGQTGRYNKSKTTRNYEVTETSTKKIDAPGKVVRTSVAVLVNVPNAAPAAPAAPGQVAQPPQYEVAAADVAKIEKVISAAALIDPAKGDQINVQAVPFNPAVATVEVAQRGTATATQVLGVPLWALVALGIVGALVLVGVLVMRARRSSFRPTTEMPSFDSQLAEDFPSFEEHPMLEGTPAGLVAPVRSAADITREHMMEYVTGVAQENPDSIAKLIKLWLAE